MHIPNAVFAAMLFIALWEREFGNLHYTNKDVPKFVVSLDDRIDSPYRDVEHLNIMQFLAWAEE